MLKNAHHQNIVNAIKRIPHGCVSSYGEVAAAAGLPGRARLVAKVLSDSAELNLPWHRVLRASGHIAFPVDSALFNEQTQRLRAEGVDVLQGKVKLKKKTLDLDALLWAPD
jgi:methylated-DNA-protein-cysteine methyltransferase related protein